MELLGGGASEKSGLTSAARARRLVSPQNGTAVLKGLSATVEGVARSIRQNEGKKKGHHPPKEDLKKKTLPLLIVVWWDS